MYHRGPDDAGAEFLKDGFVALGHRRLSILDLSSSGRQPMQVDQLWIVFNGEIYNYKELRLILESKGFALNQTVIPKYYFTDINTGVRTYATNLVVCSPS